MADNIAVTQGSGKTVATDDVGGVQYQRIKIAYGAEGSATMVLGAATGLPVRIGDTGGHAAVVNPDGSLNIRIGDTGGTPAATDANGSLKVVQYDSSGNEQTSIAVAEDAGLSGGESGILAMGKYVAVPTQGAGTANDATHAIYGPDGREFVDGGKSGVFTAVSINPEDTGSGYATGDVLGGRQYFINSARVDAQGGTATTFHATILDTGSTWAASDLELWLFSDSGGGTYQDHNAFALDADDIDLLVDVVDLDTKFDGNGYTILSATKTVSYELAGTNLVVLPVIRATTPVFDGDTGGVWIGGTRILD